MRGNLGQETQRALFQLLKTNQLYSQCLSPPSLLLEHELPECEAQAECVPNYFYQGVCVCGVCVCVSASVCLCLSVCQGVCVFTGIGAHSG